MNILLRSHADRRLPALTLAAALGLALAGCAGAPVATTGSAPLTDAGGRTLYTFDKDGDGVSRCAATCTATWPPYVVKAGENPAGMSAITREDGSRQWSLAGRPLYFFAGDQKPGDARGDGVGGVWHLARNAAPAATVASSSGSSYGY